MHFIESKFFIHISQKFFPKGTIDNKWALLQGMAWRRIGDKPLPEPMLIQFTRHICGTKGRWVNSLASGRYGSDLKTMIFICIIQNGSLSTPYEIALRWMLKNLTKRSQHRLRYWLGAIRQQAITCTNVDPDLCCHMASLGHIESICIPRRHVQPCVVRILPADADDLAMQF